MKKGFSVELNEKKYVKNVSLSNESHDRVLIDGVIGPISSVTILEESVIEFVGKNGVIRIDIDPVLLRKNLFEKISESHAPILGQIKEKRER